MDVQLKLNKFSLKRENIFFNHEYEVNLQKRFPGDATSYILWMSCFKQGQIIYLHTGKI